MKRTAGAHPRSRGADFHASIRARYASGSSPLARGGLHRPRRLFRGRGLIPARAGRTSSSATLTCSTGAHPRSRGADQRFLGRTDSEAGSSPLARGGQEPAPVGGSPPGLIPARAGRTDQTGRRAWGRRAHPRSRGADRRLTERIRLTAGSSPLARGGPGWGASAASR